MKLSAYFNLPVHLPPSNSNPGAHVTGRTWVVVTTGVVETSVDVMSVVESGPGVEAFTEM